MNAELDALEKLLRAHLEGHARMLGCMGCKSEALRHARIEAVTDLVTQEQAIMQQLGEIERHRLALTRRITRMLQPDADEAMSLKEILTTVTDESRRSRLTKLADELHDSVDQVRSKSSMLRSAAEALAKHMAGVMQTVHSALSRAGVYSPKGNVAVGTQLDYSIDIKS